MGRLHLSAKDLEAVRVAFGFATVEEMQEFIETQEYKRNERLVNGKVKSV